MTPTPRIVDGLPRCQRECEAYQAPRHWSQYDRCTIGDRNTTVSALCEPAIRRQTELLTRYRQLRLALLTLPFGLKPHGWATNVQPKLDDLDKEDPFCA